MNNQYIIIDNNSCGEKPLVSVVVPTYNSSNFIFGTISSIVVPDDIYIEIIIIDDGSTDNTLEVLNQYYEFNQMVKIISVSNGGVSKARNIGIENAQGEFICFLDSDDQLEADFFPTLIKKIRKNNVDVQLCGYYKHYKNSIDKQPSLYCNENFLVRYLSGDISFHIGSMIINRSFIDYHNIRFNEKLYFGEDILFICQVLALAKCKMSLDYLYHHNYREGSLTTSLWNEDDYLHDIFAMETLDKEILEIYNGEDKREVLISLKANVFDRKLRYLWKLFLNKRYKSLKKLCNENFLDMEKYVNVNELPAKYKKRVMIFKLNNITLWKIIRFFNFKKVKAMW